MIRLRLASLIDILLDRVNGLWVVLDNIDDISSDLDMKRQLELCSLTDACCSVLNDLYKALNQYRILDSKLISIGDKSRYVWKRLRWEPEEIKALRSRITSNITLLTNFYGGITWSGPSILDLKNLSVTDGCQELITSHEARC